MPGRQGDVEFNADVTGYTNSLTQAIAVTNQYSQAADTMLGKVAKIGGEISNQLIKKTAGYTQANKVATAQAAAYQQKLSGLEATAKVLGKDTFPRIERATLSLARQFPVGINTAVEQMEALQESGVTSVKTMENLAKSYTALGAATGAHGPAIGRQMTELTRSMGNNLSMVDGMNDSLVTLTKTYGGSAAGVLTFAKSLAPIASTVGMGQSQVMGLSTAFARLGEDGFAAGNAMNKVMLDLNKSVREGSPEMRQYADVLGKSVSQLREQFTADPTSVLIEFTEAINKQGPAAIHTLESLGIEGVRTVKAITALSSQGNLGEIMKTATSAYGGGSTMEAAKTAMSGVNDEITKLNETMSQMVASSAKPFLGVMQDVLRISNSIAGVFAKVVASPIGQKAGFLAQVGGALGQGAMSLIGTASTVALGIRGARFVGSTARGFGVGRSLGADANAHPDLAGGMRGVAGDQGWSSRAGFAWANMMGTPYANTGGGFGGLRDRLHSGVAQSFNLARSTAVLGALTTRSDQLTARGLPGMRTSLGMAVRMGMNQANDLRAAGDLTGATKKMMSTMAMAEKAMASSGQAFGRLAPAIMSLIGTSAGTMGVLGKGAGKAGLGALSLLGMGSPWVGAAVGAGAVGYGLYKYNQNQDSGYKAMEANKEDPYRQFNDFAERAGYATEQLTALGNAAAETTKAFLASANTTDQDYATLSAEEISKANESGYVPSWQGATGNPLDDAMRMFTSNPNMTPQQVNQIGMDIQNQRGGDTGQNSMNEYFNLQKGGKLDPKAWAKSVVDLYGLTGPTETSRLASESGAGYYRQRADAAAQQSPEAGARQREQDLKQIWDDAASSAGAIRNELVGLFASLSGVSKSDVEKGLPLSQAGQQTGGTRAYSGGSATTQSWSGYGAPLSSAATPVMPTAQDATAAFERFLGANANKGDINALVEARKNRLAGKALPQWEERAVDTDRKTTESTTNKLIGVNTKLVDAMVGAKQLQEKTAKTWTELTDVEKQALTKTQRAVGESLWQPSDLNKQMMAARLVAEDAIKQAGGSTTKAKLSLTSALSTSGTDQDRAILQAAMGVLPQTRASVIEQGTMSQAAKWTAAEQAARTAQQITLPENAPQAAVEAQQQTIAEGAQATMTKQETAKSYAKQVRDAAISMTRQTEDFNRQQKRTQDDFRRDQGWAADDFHHSQWLAERNYNQQMAWQARDYHLSVMRANRDYNLSVKYMAADHRVAEFRANRDFNRQMRYAEQDHQVSEFRAQRDFDRNREIANRDFKKQVFRAERDFNLQMTWQEEDYRRSLMRGQRDFNKQMARQEEAYQLQVSRSKRDYFKQVSRTEEDYQRQRLYAFADHDRQLAYQIKDNAKRMFDPYTRVMHEQVWDTKQLLGNIVEQNKMAAKQLESIQALKEAGLSQNAIDIFGLSDPAKAQQTFRMAKEALADPELIRQLNAAIEGKVNLAGAFTTSQSNESFRRTEEEFKISMERSANEHEIQTKRVAEDFNTALADMAQNNTIARTQAQADFAISLADTETDYAISVEHARTLHNTQMSDMDADFKVSMEDSLKAFQISMADLDTDYAKMVARQKKAHNTQMTDMEDDYNKTVARQATAHKNQMSDMETSYNDSVARAATLHTQQMAEAERQYGLQVERQQKLLDTSLARGREDLSIQQLRIIEDLKLAASDITGDYGDLIRSATDAIAKLPKELQGPAKEALNELLGAMGQTMTDGKGKLTGPAGQLQAGVADTLAGPPDWAGNLGKDTVENYASGLTKGKTDPKGSDKKAGEVFDSMEGLLTGPEKWALNLGSTHIGNLAAGIGDEKKTATDAAGDVQAGVASSLSGPDRWGNILGGNFDAQLGAGMKAGKSDATTPAEEVQQGVWNKLHGGPDGLEGGWANPTGAGITADLGRGILSGKQGVADAGATIAATAKTSATADPDDPKKGVGKTIGETIGSGVADGITGQKSNIETAFGEVLTGLQGLAKTRTVTVGVKVSGTGSPARGEGGTPNANEQPATGKGGQNVEKSKSARYGIWSSSLYNYFDSEVGGDFHGHDPYRRCMQNVAEGMDHAGIPRRNAGADGPEWVIPKISLHKGYAAPRGALYWWHGGPGGVGGAYGHVAVADGNGDAINNWSGHFVDERSASSMAPGAYAGWSYGYAQGGIATREHIGKVAEAGFPEAMIPLNERGASYMAQVMGRYLDNNEVKAAQSACYSTTVNYYNYSYDQSTKVNGPITVVSSDPNEMARKLDAKVRTNRLVSPR